jgi:hypothetical protein
MGSRPSASGSTRPLVRAPSAEPGSSNRPAMVPENCRRWMRAAPGGSGAEAAQASTTGGGLAGPAHNPKSRGASRGTGRGTLPDDGMGGERIFEAGERFLGDPIGLRTRDGQDRSGQGIERAQGHRLPPPIGNPLDEHALGGGDREVFLCEVEGLSAGLRPRLFDRMPHGRRLLRHPLQERAEGAVMGLGPTREVRSAVPAPRLEDEGDALVDGQAVPPVIGAEGADAHRQGGAGRPGGSGRR